MCVNAATAVCRALPFKVLMSILNMPLPLLRIIYQIFPSPRKSASRDFYNYAVKARKDVTRSSRR